MLQVKKIIKEFGGITALNSCSLSVDRDNITAIVGPNGAGKTTLFDAIAGFVSLDSGFISLNGVRLDKLSSHRIARIGVARTWQQTRLFESLLVWQHLAIVEENKNPGMLHSLFDKKKVPRKRYEKYLTGFGLDDVLETRAGFLSYGQGKLLQLAMVLFKPHQLILLDEPIAGVSQVVQRLIEKKLMGLKEKRETVVIIEHNIEFVKTIADKVIFIDQGMVLLEGTPDRVFSDKRVLEAYLGD